MTQNDFLIRIGLEGDKAGNEQVLSGILSQVRAALSQKFNINFNTVRANKSLSETEQQADLLRQQLELDNQTFAEMQKYISKLSVSSTNVVTKASDGTESVRKEIDGLNLVLKDANDKVVSINIPIGQMMSTLSSGQQIQKNLNQSINDTNKAQQSSASDAVQAQSKLSDAISDTSKEAQKATEDITNAQKKQADAVSESVFNVGQQGLSNPYTGDKSRFETITNEDLDKIFGVSEGLEDVANSASDADGAISLFNKDVASSDVTTSVVKDTENIDVYVAHLKNMYEEAIALKKKENESNTGEGQAKYAEDYSQALIGIQKEIDAHKELNDILTVQKTIKTEESKLESASTGEAIQTVKRYIFL